MARLTVAVVGGVIGAFFGVPQLGFAIGSALGGALFPGEGPDVEGPRLGDKSVTSSAYGVGIPICYGTMRMGGNVIWSTGIEEVKTKTEEGGKGGGPTSTTTTYEYFSTFAIAFCAGEAEDVLRLWMDGKLVYDKTTSGDEVTKVNLNYRFYPGSETQEPDSLIEDDKGVDATPAYRGLCYLVFEKLALKDFGNRLPNITAEITFNASDTQPQQQFDFLTVAEGGVTDDWDSDTILPDFNRGVFYFSHWTTSASVSVLRRGNTRTMVEDRQVFLDAGSGNVTLINPLVVMPDGSILTNHGGSNSRPISMVNPDSLEIVSTFGSSNSGTGNTKTGFVAAGPGAVISIGGTINHALIPSIGSSFDSIGILNATTGGVLTYVWDSETATGQPTPTFQSNERMKSVCGGAVGSTFGDGYVLAGSRYTSADSDLVNIYRARLSGGAQYNATFDTYSAISVTNVASLTPGDILPGETQLQGAGNLVYDPTDDTIIFEVVTSSFVYWMIKLDPDTGTILWRTATGRGNTGLAHYSKSRITNGVLAMATSDRVFALRTSTGEIFYDESGWTLEHFSSGGEWWDGETNNIIGSGSGGIVKWQLFRGSGNGETLDTIVTDLTERVGLDAPDIDVTDLATETLPGYILAGPMSVRSAIQPLANSFFFDGVESDYLLKFELRDGKTPVVDIPQDDLSTLDGSGDFWRESRMQEVELPSRFTITYLDSENDYLQNSHSAKRLLGPTPTMSSRNELALQIPAALSTDFAKQAAEKALYSAWIERSNYASQIPWTYLALDPTDVVTVTLDDGTVFRQRIVDLDVGIDFTIDVKGLSEDAAQYTSDVASDGGDSGLVNEFVSNTFSRLIMLCSPLLQDADDTGRTTSNLYFLMGGYGQTGWEAGSLYKSAENTQYALVGSVVNEMSWGTASNALGDTDTPFSTDETNTLTVFMNTGADNLSSVTQLEMVNGANGAALIKANGVDVEIIQFRDVVVNNDGSRTLSGLLRGRRGTETQTPDHAAGDIFVLLNTTDVSNVQTALGEKDLDRYYRPVTSGSLFEDAPTTTKASPLNDLKPYAVNDQAAAPSGNDIILTWKRQTRVGGEMQDGTDEVPLNEDSEEYEIDILDGPGGSIVRNVLALATPTYTYTEADQNTDGFTPPESQITVVIYQISAQVGRGFAEEVTLDVE